MNKLHAHGIIFLMRGYFRGELILEVVLYPLKGA